MRQVNLLPEELQKKEYFRPIRNSFILASVLAFLVMLSIHLLLAWRLNRLATAASKPDIVQEAPEISRLHQHLDGAKLEQQKFIEKNSAWLEISAQRLPYLYILETIGGAIAERAWLEKLSIDTAQRVCRLEGGSFSTQLVSEFMLELKKLAFFENIELTSLEKESEKTKKQVNFKIVCKFK